MVLARSHRGHGARVLALLGTGLRRLARARVDDVVVGGRLNLAWNCVHRWAESDRADAEAAAWQLYRFVARQWCDASSSPSRDKTAFALAAETMLPFCSNSASALST